MFKRFGLLILTNFLIMIALSLVLNLLGIKPYLSAQGIDYSALMAFCLVWGMGGAFISLAMSKMMAKMMMGVQIIEPQNMQYRNLISKVHQYAKSAGLSKMPEVGIYQSPEINAFATGPSRSNSLVAVSTGLLHSMTEDEVDGVLAHEVAHIANGDMVTMTLIQGVVNAFVMFLARVAAFAVQNMMRGDNNRQAGHNPFVYFITVMVFQVIFGFLGMIVVSYFSRRREFRADEGGARYAGKKKMIAALQKLQSRYEQMSADSSAVSTLKISSKGSGLTALVSTHPPLDVRISALMNKPIA